MIWESLLVEALSDNGGLRRSSKIINALRSEVCLRLNCRNGACLSLAKHEIVEKLVKSSVGM